jgi:hypothetical protein
MRLPLALVACSPLMLWYMAAAGTPAARAALVVVTITGTVSTGTDGSGVFGTPNSALDGQSFTLVLALDDMQGQQYTYNCTGVPCGSEIYIATQPNNATAVLQIGGGSYTFAASISADARRDVAPAINDASFSLNGIFGNAVGATISPAPGAAFTTDYSWEAPFSSSALSSNSIGSFSIMPSMPGVKAVAYGNLLAKSISVIGLGECLNGRADLFGLDSHLPPRAPALPPRECQPNPACPVAQFVRLMSALIPPQPPAPMGLAYMMAQFTVPQPGTLATYAMQCGFIGFDWQQQITTDPGGSVGAETQPADPEPLIATGNVAYLGKPVSVTDNLCELWIDGCSLIAPPAYADPPYGGYVGNVVNAYPFFIPYTAKFLTPPASPADGVCLIENCSALGLPYAVSPDDRTLSFLDAPKRTQLPAGTFVVFKTTLVGISTRGSVRCGFRSRLYCTPLYTWTWATNFTGSSGEVRVTSINGIPQ